MDYNFIQIIQQQVLHGKFKINVIITRLRIIGSFRIKIVQI